MMLLSLLASKFVQILAFLEGVTRWVPWSISGNTMCYCVAGVILLFASCVCWYVCTAGLRFLQHEICCRFRSNSITSTLPDCLGGQSDPHRLLSPEFPESPNAVQPWLEHLRTLACDSVWSVPSYVVVTAHQAVSRIAHVFPSFALYRVTYATTTLSLPPALFFYRASSVSSLCQSLGRLLTLHSPVWPDEESSGIKPQVFVARETSVHPSTGRRCVVRYPPGHLQHRRQKTHQVVAVLTCALILLAFLLLSRAVPQSSPVVRYSMSCSLADTGPADIALPLVPAASLHAFFTGESPSLFSHWQHVQCVQSRVIVPTKSLASLHAVAINLQNVAAASARDFASSLF